HEHGVRLVLGRERERGSLAAVPGFGVGDGGVEVDVAEEELEVSQSEAGVRLDPLRTDGAGSVPVAEEPVCLSRRTRLDDGYEGVLELREVEGLVERERDAVEEYGLDVHVERAAIGGLRVHVVAEGEDALEGPLLGQLEEHRRRLVTEPAGESGAYVLGEPVERGGAGEREEPERVVVVAPES